jgi:hypothetical protein
MNICLDEDGNKYYWSKHINSKAGETILKIKKFLYSQTLTIFLGEDNFNGQVDINHIKGSIRVSEVADILIVVMNSGRWKWLKHRWFNINKMNSIPSDFIELG